MNIILLLRRLSFVSLLLPQLLFGQTRYNRGELAMCLNPEEAGSRSETEAVTWVEDIGARTLTSSTYYSSQGDIRIRSSSRPINYYNASNELVPIDPNLKKINTSTWAAINQPFPTYFYSDGSMGLTLDPKGERMKLGMSCAMNDQPLNMDVEITGSGFISRNAAPGVDKEFIFRENGVKYNYVLKQPQIFQAALSFSEEFVLPEGYRIEANTHRDGKPTEKGWSGTLSVTDKDGRVVATLYEPFCYDANGQYMIASYQVEKSKNAWVLSIVVDENWLNATDRSYPVVIDPIIVGPTTTWTGGQMPSCFLPSYNADSILVNIPGGITITQLNITASFYADPWTGAWMEDGQMYFSTSCANSQTFSITGPSGQTAGTAYLDYYNIYNPLTCCFGESCNPQSFWLTYHLARNQWGAGCNTTYIRYDPITTSWPFEAEIVGKTPESYSSQWNVPAAAICANQCDITGIAYVYYGVPPYTFTHPWSNDTITQGTNVGCSNGATTAVFDLTIPNCPVYCDTVNTTLTVPPPTIVDACGNVVTGLPNDQVPLKPVPMLNPVYDSTICSGDPFLIDLTPCIPGAVVTWNENWNVGYGNIEDTIVNNSSSPAVYNYTASASLNGCNSDTLDLPLYVLPLPVPDYNTDPSPIVSGLETNFSDVSVFNGANGISWYYTFGDGTDAYVPDPVHTYFVPGDYTICLAVADDTGCNNEICSLVTVVPAELVMPNVVTPNDDDVNDFLAFKYLDFYPDNMLTVLNRWGTPIFEKEYYTNDWKPENHTEGVYYYRLEIRATGKVYDGFFYIVK